MTNLTIENHVAKLLGSPHPEPNHHVLVYEIKNGGKRLRHHLLPGQILRRPWYRWLFPERVELVAYGVRADSKLCHDFSGLFQTREKGVSVLIEAEAHFAVLDVPSFGDQLFEDPLSRLEREIRSQVKRAMRSIEWDRVRDGEIDLEASLLDHFLIEPGGREVTCLHSLQDFAQALGLQLSTLRLDWRLPAGIEVSVVTKQQIEGQADLDQAAHEKRLRDTHYQYDVQTVTESRELELKESIRRRALEVNQQEKLLVTAVEGLQKAITTSADRIESFEDLNSAVGQVLSIAGHLKQMNVGTGQVELTEGQIAQPARLLEDRTTARSSTVDTIECLLATVGDVDEVGSDGLADGLHAVAESIREEPDPETMRRHSAAFRDVLTRLVADQKVSRDQLSLLKALAYPESAGSVEAGMDEEDG